VCHTFGKRAFPTPDRSHNHWAVGVFGMGEGWHNNHHAFQSSVRQGFRWWEWDPTYYLLKALSWTGLIWDLKAPPRSVLRNEQKLGAKTIEKAAAEVAASFDLEAIIRHVRTTLEHAPADLRRAFTTARDRAAEMLPTLHLPHLPSRAEIQRQAAKVLARTPSMDDIVDRAHRILLERIFARLPIKA
jgi:stearoyl-CoA desaturase (delta-9 desaturase)